jgi:hypothetical protein
VQVQKGYLVFQVSLSSNTFVPVCKVPMSFMKSAARAALIGWEREPVVAFSIALSVLSVGIALVVPPTRKKLFSKPAPQEIYATDDQVRSAMKAMTASMKSGSVKD